MISYILAPIIFMLVIVIVLNFKTIKWLKEMNKDFATENNKLRKELYQREQKHAEERQDLYNRIMSGNVHDYKGYTGNKPKKKDNFLKKSIDQQKAQNVTLDE